MSDVLTFMRGYILRIRILGIYVQLSSTRRVVVSLLVKHFRQGAGRNAASKGTLTTASCKRCRI